MTVPGGAERNAFDSGELIDEELSVKTFNIHTCRARIWTLLTGAKTVLVVLQSCRHATDSNLFA